MENGVKSDPVQVIRKIPIPLKFNLLLVLEFFCVPAAVWLKVGGTDSITRGVGRCIGGDLRDSMPGDADGIHSSASWRDLC